MPTPAKDRKSIAIKLQDGQPLTRVDLQYDLLHYIFANDKAVFTDINTSIDGRPPRSKVTFRDLYLNTLLRSPKCSRGPREKALENPDFGTEFAKIALLTNAGRINTTMAFFPEMRTALRTYHPVPSLQKTNGNLQDAPRIKNILKDCHLPSEGKGLPPPNPVDILSRAQTKEAPATTMVNLLFSITHPSYSAMVGCSHWDPKLGLEWGDLFTPIAYSSESRAKAFLWLCYHYVESMSITENPFADDYTKTHKGYCPKLIPLTPEEMALENVDTQEELAAGVAMTERRKDFLAKFKQASSAKITQKEKEKEREKERGVGSVSHGSPGRRESAPLQSRSHSTRERLATIPAPTPQSRISIIESGMPSRGLSPSGLSHRHYVPTNETQPRSPSPRPLSSRPINYSLPPPGWPKRSLLDNAFQLALNTDPLADSDEEDEGSRCDYIFRLHVVNRLRGRPPTPEPDEPDFAPSSSTPIDIVREHHSRDGRVSLGR